MSRSYTSLLCYLCQAVQRERGLSLSETQGIYRSTDAAPTKPSSVSERGR